MKHIMQVFVFTTVFVFFFISSIEWLVYAAANYNGFVFIFMLSVFVGVMLALVAWLHEHA